MILVIDLGCSTIELTYSIPGHKIPPNTNAMVAQPETGKKSKNMSLTLYTI